MMGALCFKQQSNEMRYRKISDLKSEENIEMRKLNDNFYTITRRGKRWSKKQIKLLEKYVNYKMFLPIPRDFVREAIFGTQDPDEKEYYNSPPKFILLNFDSKNGKRQSLRGLASVSTDGIGEEHTYPHNGMPALEFKYYTLEIIGNISLRGKPSSAVKERHGVKVKSGKDMLDCLKRVGIKGGYQYLKLNAMENVIGFYWKYGWRFHEFPATQRDCSHNIVAERVEKLNTVNKLITPAKYTEHDEIRNQLLTKYFDRYLEDYYCVQTLSRGNTRGEDYENYEITETLTYKRWDMRFQGYPMYWQCK